MIKEDGWVREELEFRCLNSLLLGYNQELCLSCQVSDSLYIRWLNDLDEWSRTILPGHDEEHALGVRHHSHLCK